VLAALVTAAGIAVMVRKRSQPARMNDPVLGARLLVPLGVATFAVAVLALVLRLTSGMATMSVRSA
jgi:hypothetical protein